MPRDLEELTALLAELHAKAARYDFLCRHHTQAIGELLGLSRGTTSPRDIAARIDLFLDPLGEHDDFPAAH